MHQKPFPVIDMVETGKNIMRLREERGMTVRDLQAYFGFEEPQAIYKWQRGQSLPTVDNLYALAALLEVSMDEILVPSQPKLNMVCFEQQANAAYCSSFFSGQTVSHRRCGRKLWPLRPFCLKGSPLPRQVGNSLWQLYRTCSHRN